MDTTLNGFPYVEADDPIIDYPVVSLELAEAVEAAVGGDGWQELPAGFTFNAADAPTYVLNTPSNLTGVLGPGARFSCIQAGTRRYFIVTAIAAGTITLYGGTDYTLANVATTGALFSLKKAPLGFPLAKEKWTVEGTSTATSIQGNAVSGTWYNLGGSFNVPIGAWELSWDAVIADDTPNMNNFNAWVRGTLSTGNNTESHPELTAAHRFYTAGTAAYLIAYHAHGGPKHVSFAAKTTMYLNASAPAGGTGVSVGVYGGSGYTPVKLRAVCAYL